MEGALGGRLIHRVEESVMAEKMQKYRAVFVDQDGNEIDPDRERKVQKVKVRFVDQDGNETDD